MDSHENHAFQPEMTPVKESRESAAPEPEREPTLGEWLRSNGPVLAILGALFVYLYLKFDTDGLLAIGKAAVGLGFVIFIHELGHFLVAKWCDVHVTVFSIGFGPAIPGCTFQRGETTYKLALFPLGGYVQMVGQVDGDESGDGSDDDPRSYRNKTVGQRMAIISAGVVMNVILAVICFVVVFQGPGKDRKAAIVGAVDTGSPAYRKALPVGAVIDQIGSVKKPYFEDLMVTVMGTEADEQLDIVYRLPHKEPQALKIEPRKSDTDDRPMLGISPAPAPQFGLKRDYQRGLKNPVRPRSSAAGATPAPPEFGDALVAMTDPKTLEVTELPRDPRQPDGDQRDYFEFARRMRLLAGKSVTIQVERTDENGKKERKDITLPPAYHFTIGARMQMGQITALRQGGPGEAAGVQSRVPTKSHEGDVIEQVEVTEPDGGVTRFPEEPRRFLGLPLGEGRPLDPVRLPDQLRAWAKRLGDAGKAGERFVTLQVRRHGVQAGGPIHETKRLKLKWDEAWQDNNEVPMGLNSPLSIPGLGLAYQVKTTVAGVEGGAADDPAKALQAGDVVKKLRYLAVSGGKDESKLSDWFDLTSEQWAQVFMILQMPQITEVQVEVERTGKDGTRAVKTVVLTPGAVKDWPQEDRGLLLGPDLRRQKADGFLDAIGLGLKDTRNSMTQVYQNLRGMLTGRISVKNLGGPLTIGVVAYRIAGIDFWEFVFFLGLISVNLAVINFLPIPVLDGGHMVFLVYEKIRGKPASEGVRVGATYAGLLLIASLMIFVLYLDITRWF